MVEKKCEICGELFLARAKNYKYCSNCRKKAGYNRVIKYRTARAESKEKTIAINSSQDILKKSPYSDVFYSIYDTLLKELKNLLEITQS
jgi:galactose-1-phosphate uridylyltransferase